MTTVTYASEVDDYEVRPRFELFVEATAQDALFCIEQRLGATDRWEGWVTAPYAELHLPQSQRHLWSPLLAIEAEDTAGGAHLRCRLQPEGPVWTMFMAGAAIITIGFVFASLLGVSQWLAAQTPWAAYVGMPAAACAGAALYFLVLSGKRLAADQMQELCKAIRECVRDLDPTMVEVNSPARVSRGFGWARGGTASDERIETAAEHAPDRDKDVSPNSFIIGSATSD